MIQFSGPVRLKITALSILCILSFSCKKENSTATNNFVQPTALSQNSAFNFSKLTFNENVNQLLSKTLDTTDTGFTGNNPEVFLFTKEMGDSQLADRQFEYPEKRYIYKTKETDSIAQFDGIYFNRVIIETTTDKKITAIIGKTKFANKKDLDSVLTKLAKKYGKTSDMVENDRHNAEVDAELGKNLNDTQREMLKDSNPETDYTAYLLDYSNNTFREWNLKDRVIQIGITTDREISVSTNKEENYNIEYFYVTFLIVKKDEYDAMEKAQIEKAKITVNDAALVPHKFYTLYSLDPYENQDRRLELEKIKAGK